MLHPQGLEFGLDSRFAIAAIGGHGFGQLSEERRDAGDGRHEHGGIERVALFDVVVDDDAIDVVGYLCLVPELHRLAQSALADGTGIGVVEGDQPGGAIGDLAGKSEAGLADDLVQGAIVASSSATSAVAFPVAASPARRSPRRAFMATTWASLTAASAMEASSPVRPSTSSFASPLRLRSQAAI